MFCHQAIAANKRLREALAKQKEVESERTGKLEKYDSTSIGNRVRVSTNVFFLIFIFIIRLFIH